MKKFMISLLSIVLAGAVIVILFLSLAKESGPRYVYKGNTERVPIAIKPKEYQCSECNMEIEKLFYSAEIITKDGKTYFFDEISCAVLWLNENKPKDVIATTRVLDGDGWVDIKDAWYTRVAPTPMGYGMAAYEKKRDDLISFDDMRLLVLQGKTLQDPFVKKSLLKQ